MGTYPAISYATHDREDIDTFSQAVSAPGPFMEFGEFLRLEATSTDASATLRLNGKFLSTDGEIRFFTEDMVITGTGTQTAVTSRIGPCWLMGFSVRVVAGTITDGEVVASVHVARDAPTAPIHVMTLASGEITNTRALGMGAFLIRGPDATSSAQPTIATATAAPAAGADFTITVTASQVWEYQSLYFKLATSATVANREVYVKVTDGTNTLWLMSYTAYQTASLNRNYNVSPLGGTFNSVGGTDYVMMTPRFMLGPGYVVSSFISGMAAGDQLSNIRLLYRQY